MMKLSQVNRLIKLYETLGQSGKMTLEDASETLWALRDYKTHMLQDALLEEGGKREQKRV